MKRIEFSKNSWHCWFVSKTTDYLDYANADETIHGDICGYTRAFIFGIIKCILAFSVLALFIVPMSAAAVFGFCKLFHLLFWAGWTKTAGTGVIMWTVGLVFVSIGVVDHLNDLRVAKKTPKPPGAIKLMYQHWKEKTCALIEFK